MNDAGQARRERQTIIRPRSGWQWINWSEISEYRDLFQFLVWRDVSVLYKQTVLGFGWAVIRPVFSMVVFTFIFGRLAGVPSDGVPFALFTFTALVPWTYFSTAVTKSTGSLVANVQLLTKVYFPRLIIPLTPVIAGLVDTAIALGILALLMVWFGVAPNAGIVFVPVLLMIMVLAAAGMGLWLSALSVQYRDVNQAMQFLIQLLMYAAPVVWPASLISTQFPAREQEIRLLYGLYPMAGVIEGLRAALLGTGPMPWDLIIVGGLSAVAVTWTGALYFRSMERTFADVA